MELENGVGNTSVTLTIPSTPEYVGIARLVVLGVASRMGFSYDEVEDLRLAVAEVCTAAIERLRSTSVAGVTPLVTVVCHADGDTLTIDIEDPATTVTETEGGGEDEMDSHEISALLVEILVDEVATQPLDGGGTRVRLIKRVTGNGGANLSELSLGNGR